MARKRGVGKMNCRFRLSPHLEGTQTEAAVLLFSPIHLRGRAGGGEKSRTTKFLKFSLPIGFPPVAD